MARTEISENPPSNFIQGTIFACAKVSVMYLFYADYNRSMSADSSTKTIQITSSVAESLSPSNYEDIDPKRGGGKTRRNPKSERIRVTRDGGAMSPGTLDQLVSTRAPGVTDSSQALGTSSKMTEEAAPVGKVTPSIIGGSTEPKVHLTKKQKRSKVVLAPSVKKVKEKTRKNPAKTLKMNVGKFTRRLKKASGIHKLSKEKTIEEIKGVLIRMELVNKDTKAPEGVLRQIYSDVETMKKRAL